MPPAPPSQRRVGDLWWLLAHNEVGRRRVGSEHFAIGLAACVLGETLTQCSAYVRDAGDVVADPVVALVLGELTGAAGAGFVKAPQVWVEWLASREHARITDLVVARMTDGGLLVRQGRHVVPADGLTAFAPVTALVAAVTGRAWVSDPVRLLAGVTNACGLAPMVSTDGQDVTRPLQLLAMDLPKPLYSVVSATEEAVHAVATRRR